MKTIKNYFKMHTGEVIDSITYDGTRLEILKNEGGTFTVQSIFIDDEENPDYVIDQSIWTNVVQAFKVYKSLKEEFGFEVTMPVWTIHGSGYNNLVNQNINASQALKDALETLKKASPHARDYKDWDHYKEAKENFEKVYYAVINATNYFDHIAEEISKPLI